MGKQRAKSPIFSADLHAMIATTDADRRDRGLPAHTMESFLLHLHELVNKPQAAHQNATPQDPIEQDLIILLAAHMAPPLGGIATRVASNGW